MRVEVRGRVGYEVVYAQMQAFTAGRTPDTPDQLWLCEHPPVFTQGLAGRPDHLLAPGDIPVVATNRGGQVTYHGPGQVVAYPMVDLQRAGYFVKEYVYRLEEAVLRTLRHYGVTGHRVAGAPGIYVRLDDPFSHARLPSPRPSPAGGRGRKTGLPLPLAAGDNAGPPLPLADVRLDDPFSHARLPSPRPSPAGGRGRKTGLALPLAAGDNAGPPLPLAGEGGGEGPASPFDQLKADGVEVGKIAALGVKVSRHCTYHGVALNVAMDLEPFERIDPCGYRGLRTVDLSTMGVSATWNEAAQRLGQELSALLAP